MKALDYAVAGARVAERALAQRPRRGHEERLVFVVGCPRSGTTFTGHSPLPMPATGPYTEHVRASDKAGTTTPAGSQVSIT